MRNIDRTPPKDATGKSLEVNERVRDVASTAATLAAREAAVLAREQAADRREAGADLRDALADRREAAARSSDEHRAHTASQLLEANEHLVVAAVHAQTLTEVAENCKCPLRPNAISLPGCQTVHC